MTVSAVVVLPVLVTVNVPVLDGSAAAASVAVTVTVGSTSSSAIVTVAVLGVPTVYRADAWRVTITVSGKLDRRVVDRSYGDPSRGRAGGNGERCRSTRCSPCPPSPFPVTE